MNSIYSLWTVIIMAHPDAAAVAWRKMILLSVLSMFDLRSVGFDRSSITIIFRVLSSVPPGIYISFSLLTVGWICSPMYLVQNLWGWFCHHLSPAVFDSFKEQVCHQTQCMYGLNSSILSCCSLCAVIFISIWHHMYLFRFFWVLHNIGEKLCLSLNVGFSEW